MQYFKHLSMVGMVLLLVSCGNEASQSPASTRMPPATEATTPVVSEATPEAEVVDEIVALVANADPANGEALFNEMNSSGFACSTCHNVQNEQRLIGTGLYNIAERAATRIEGQVAERYLYDSIVHPDEYMVEDDPAYAPGLMPQNYGEIYSEQQVYDLVAYMMTLNEAP